VAAGGQKKGFIMPRLNYKILGMLAFVILSLCSCTSLNNDRRLKKFVSRFNAEEYASASTYIYPDDRMQLAFFANEVRKKVPNAFIEIERSETKDDYVVASLKWKNANDFLKNYFVYIGKPLDENDVLVDTIKVKETLDGDCFTFDWGIPEINTENLRLASISEENVERMNIRAEARKGSRIIGKLKKGDDILIADDGKGWSRCYQINNESKVETGYIYTANMSIKDSAFFSLGIFDSMSLLVALIIIVVICVPLFFLRGVVESIMNAGCVGMTVCVSLLLVLIYVIYQLIEKILFELFIVNLPY